MESFMNFTEFPSFNFFSQNKKFPETNYYSAEIANCLFIQVNSFNNILIRFPLTVNINIPSISSKNYNSTYTMRSKVEPVMGEYILEDVTTRVYITQANCHESRSCSHHNPAAHYLIPQVIFFRHHWRPAQ